MNFNPMKKPLKKKSPSKQDLAIAVSKDPVVVSNEHL